MKIDSKHMDSKKRLKNISYKQMIEGKNIETSFGKEFIICSKSIEKDGKVTNISYLQTIIPTLIGGRKALVKTDYYFLELKKDGIDMQLIFENDLLYNPLVKAARDVDLYNKLEENLK